MKYKFVIALMSILFVPSLQAIEILGAKVISVQSYTNGTIGVFTDKQTANPEGCEPANKYIIPFTEKGTSGSLSVLLTAKVSSSLVDIYIDDNECSFGYPQVTSVILK